MKVKKAVILAAGYGTRMLPASKAVAKEMLPIIDKPAIQFLVEEACQSGIEEVLIIISRGKSAIEDHFDNIPELENILLSKNKREEYELVHDIAKDLHIEFVRQKSMRGTGDAVYHARSFAKNEPFLMMYGDDVILGDIPASKEMCDAYEKYQKSVIGMKQISKEEIVRCSSLAVNHIEGNIYEVTDMIEKPKENEILSYFSVQGRIILTPAIFKAIENTKPGAGGEIQLTDALLAVSKKEGAIGVDYSATRYDMGNRLGVVKAIVERALKHELIKDDFKKYIKEVVKNLD